MCTPQYKHNTLLATHFGLQNRLNDGNDDRTPERNMALQLGLPIHTSGYCKWWWLRLEIGGAIIPAPCQ
jgi:hypothetical protein